MTPVFRQETEESEPALADEEMAPEVIVARPIPRAREGRPVPVSEDGFLQRVEDLPWGGEQTPAVEEETLAAFRGAFAAWREAGQDAESTAALRLAIGTYPHETTLAAASILMRRGTDQDRMDALWAVASEFGSSPDAEPSVRANAPETELPPDAPLDENGLTPDEEREAFETHAIAAIVSAGFEDDSEDVRTSALDTISMLPRELSDVLYGQLLCSDTELSSDIRHALMEKIDGATGPEAVTLFVQAMQSPDPFVADTAKRNLESMAGRPFQSIFEVLAWLEPDVVPEQPSVEPEETNP